MSYVFPFGQKLEIVKQEDRSPKKFFVLGVYASAVHARWRGIDNKIKINALAVASEPYIFWKGDGCREIIGKISMPKELGTLEPALPKYNGPSGNTLDDKFLKPLGTERSEAWLCDLLPYSRINSNQRKALDKYYEPEVSRFSLPKCTVPNFTQTELKSQYNRHIEVMQEIEESKCNTIILLGDLPIKYWLSHFTRFRKLADFGDTFDRYGKTYDIKLNGKNFNILPLVHPRQAGNLGKASKKWNELHNQWVANHT